MIKVERAAIVLAAGKGTRMKSGIAKVLHEANGRPLAWYPIRRALDLGCNPVVVVVGHQGAQVRERLEALFPKAPLRFAVQAEQRGTGHAVGRAKAALRGHEGRILILYGDVPLLTAATLKKLSAAGRRRRLAFLAMEPADPTGYGRVIRDEAGQVRAIVEQKDASLEELRVRSCNAGLYDCDSAFLWSALRKLTSNNAQGELYLTDLVEAAWRAKEPAVAVPAPVDEVSGVNDRVELAEAARKLRRRTAEAHMRAGVSLIEPESAFIDEGVVLGTDVVVEPNVRLVGDSRIGGGATIGFGSVVTNSTIGEGTILKPYSILEDAVVGAGAVVGPFARLRPGTVLGASVHIGNFVELKKTTMGEGSKANHLAYLGDATIGSKSNVGAGTITCNYDGVNKYPTVVGDGVFVGSDSQIVAPVTIGDGAYVAAGTTVVDDVPAGSLALSRGRQVVKEGWVEKRRLSAAAEKRKVAAARRAAKRSSPKQPKTP